MTVLSQISRAFHYRDKTTFVRLYKQYVRTHLEFAIQAWQPWYQKDMEVLEKVLERAVKMIGGLKGSTCKEKLKELGLQSLEERRQEADLVLAYKVLHGICPVDAESWFTRGALAALHRNRAAADPLRLNKPRCPGQFLPGASSGFLECTPLTNKKCFISEPFQERLEKTLQCHC